MSRALCALASKPQRHLGRPNLVAPINLSRQKLDVLKGHCDRLGRPFEQIEITTLGTAHLAPGAQSAKDLIEHCRSLASLGVHHAIFNMPNVSELTALKIFKEEIIPEVTAL